MDIDGEWAADRARRISETVAMSMADAQMKLTAQRHVSPVYPAPFWAGREAPTTPHNSEFECLSARLSVYSHIYVLEGRRLRAQYPSNTPFVCLDCKGRVMAKNDAT